jgi:thiosulfate/3-mercaptopyruvate sulfurtransferase
MADHTPDPSLPPARRPTWHLFVVNVWWEPGTPAAGGEWRGTIEHVATHEKRYFRDIAVVAEFIGGRVGWDARGPPQFGSDDTRRHLGNDRLRSVTMTTPNGYAYPHVLVDTQWVADHLDDMSMRLVEVDVDTTAYDSGHIPGAIGWNWKRDTQQMVLRDIPDKAGIEELLCNSGITNDTTVIVYGDNNNWFATYAFWLLKLYGHRDVRVMDGGRKKWVDEGRPLASDVPAIPRADYHASGPLTAIRARRDEVHETLHRHDHRLVDVRSPAEFSGELLAPENLPQEGAQRGGHIPGAANIPWSMAVREDGTFKPMDELRTLYGDRDITPDTPVIAYCRIGERSSHTWFVLTYLLGYPSVRNYDGSWTEWGSLIGAPIEK